MNPADPPSSDPELGQYWQPRYWPIWLGVACLRLLARLPYRLQMACGRGLGRLLYLVLGRRRRVAKTNLALCFPATSEVERAAILRRHFQSLGLTAVEHGLAWWGSDQQIRSLVEFRGVEHLNQALASGRGVVLLTGHFGCQEIAGRVVALDFPLTAGLYRPSRNPLIDALLKRARRRSARLLIPKDNMRAMIRALRQGYMIYYAADQSHRRAYSALVPFFGEPAMTNVALGEIARLGRAAIVPFLPMRRADGSGYILEVLPELAGITGANPEEDALNINALLEAHIRKAPEQYYWIHRRFKGRPEPWPDPYRT